MVDVSRLVIPGITDRKALLCISRARNLNQYIKYVNDVLAGKKCPFCAPLDPKYNTIIEENDLFCAWQSFAPEKHTRHHFIIVPKHHVVILSELTPEEKLAMFDIMEKLEKRFNLTHYGILIRNNAIEMAGTIEHLHIHMMVEDGTGRVESPFCKGNAADEESVNRAIVFEKIRTGTKFNDLSETEQELVKDRID